MVMNFITIPTVPRMI